MLVIIVALGVVVGANIVKQSMQNADPSQGRPRLLGRVEQAPELLERSGQKVNLAELAGKTYIASYVYTSCPKQCMGVLAELRAVGDEVGNPEKLKFLAFSLEPEADRPERLKGWAELHGVDKPNWWFLTTDKPEEMTALMTGPKSQFKLMEVTKYDPATQADIIAAEGPYAHDPRVVLVDGTGHIRGYYNLLELDPVRAQATRQTLLRDLQAVLAEQEPEGRSLWWLVGLVFAVVVFLALTGGRKPEQPATSPP
jgi:cytochrome oxidase Cu insertion factor (SCO1/SenC/PrrC family)